MSAAPETTTTTTTATPKFPPGSVTVLFILGGPGAGKGTQSAALVRDYGFVHLSAGDLLRAEQDRPGSRYGDLIRTHIREGKIVPMEITVALLAGAMEAEVEKRKEKQQKGEEASAAPARFLIDGFPRKMDQAEFFERTVARSAATVFLRCSEPVMRERLLRRGATSGRADDNADSIVKRFRTFEEQSFPVVEAYRREGKVVAVEAGEGGVEEVYARVREGIAGLDILPAK